PFPAAARHEGEGGRRDLDRPGDRRRSELSQGARALAPGASHGLLRAGDLAALVGRTPLLHLTKVTADIPPGVRIWAKLEGFNPGGSVKDRPALRMIEEGLRRGDLHPGKTIIDSTSGNTGIALAMLGAALGYPVELVVPANASVERRQIIEAYGAKVIQS